jgi:hypothetical protein
MAALPKTLLKDAAVHISRWQNVVIVDVAGDMDLPRMRAVGSAYRETAGDFPRGIVGVVMLRAGTPVASAEARGESARYMKELGNAIIQVATVIEEQGVMALMLLTVIRGVNVLTRNAKILVLKSLDEAIRSASPHVVPVDPGVSTERQLRDAVEAARRSFGRDEEVRA